MHQKTLFSNHREEEKLKRKFTFIDLFAGIGGTRLGFEKAGGECVFSSEWDKYCQKTYEANFGDIPHGDISKIDEDIIPDFDVLVAGFPCQPFSSIGKREGFTHKTQGTLFYDVVRIIQKKQPEAFLLENVPGLKTHEDGETYTIIINALNELGYNVYDKVLDSANFGVPQVRKRIYIVGFKSSSHKSIKNFSFPRGNSEKVHINNFIEKNIKGFSISKHLQEKYLFKKDDGRPQIVDTDSEIQVKTLVASYHKIQRLTGTFVRGGETGIRLLTHNECKAIMGFDKDFRIPVSRTQMYRQMGNSVVVPVVASIAKRMIKHIQESKSNS